jgi:hypothetical protein
VLIRVGTNLYGGYNRPVGGGNIEEKQKPEEFESKQIGSRGKTLKERRERFEKLIAEKKAEAKAEAEAEKTEGGNEPLAPVVPVCYPFGPSYQYNTNKYVGLVQDECGNYPCEQGFQYSPPNIVSDIDDIIWSTTFTNENGTRDFCPPTHAKGGRTWILFDDAFSVPFGSTYKIKDELIADYNIDACFKDNLWQYAIETNGDLNKIKLRVLVSMCHWGEPTDIDDINELSIIPESEACLALKDFEKHRPYQFIGMDIPYPEKYHIKDVYVNHEKVHVKFFQLDIIETLGMEDEHHGEVKSFQEHLKFTPECNELFKDKNSAKFEGKKYYDELLKKFVKKLKNVHDSRFPDFWTQENKTQWNDYVQNTINYYQRELKNNYSLDNCDYKMDWSAYEQFKNKF